MTTSIVRPDVTDLVFHVFARMVHPELLNPCSQTQIRHDAYSANIQICDAGHVLLVQTREETLCEVTASRGTALPSRKLLFHQRLRGHREKSLSFPSGMQYHVSFELEQLEPEPFLHFHEELLADSSRSSLSHCFPATNRWSPVPLSYIQIEGQAQSLLIHTFHSFPDNFAVIKTQSLIEF